MKKLTAMLLALTLCFGLAACGGNTAQDDTKDESQTVQTGKTEDKKDEAKTEEKSDETKTEDAKTETKTDDKTSTDSKTEDKTNETKPVTSSTNTTSALGAPTSKSYSPSCMGEGEDGIWTYDGFTVYTYKEGGSETVEAVQ